ncbi:MAG TPA: helix-turn-helix domain-containing protein [Oculatellaceae cyanobacterium]
MTTQKQIEVLKAAEKVFLLHGYARTTMGDIAKSARISRPALYLIFPSKEDVFRAAVEVLYTRKLACVKDVLSPHGEIGAQLIQTFEIWTVETFELVKSYPEAEDLFESSLIVAADIAERAYTEFRQMLVEAMKRASRENATKILRNGDLELSDVATVMTTAAIGFKSVAKDAIELRTLLRNQVALVLLALGY